jgi:hypothetical protein
MQWISLEADLQEETQMDKLGHEFLVGENS